MPKNVPEHCFPIEIHELGEPMSGKNRWLVADEPVEFET